MKKLTLLFFVSVLTITFAKSQIFSPQQLEEIHSIKEVKDITLKLSQTGYKEADNQWDENKAGRSYSWHFQNQPGEFSDFLLSRYEQKTGNTETHYIIYNIYLYKQFVDNLVKEEYKVEGATVQDDKSFIVFKKKNISFLIAEHQRAGEKPIYVVIVKEAQPLTKAKKS